MLSTHSVPWVCVQDMAADHAVTGLRPHPRSRCGSRRCPGHCAGRGWVIIPTAHSALVDRHECPSPIDHCAGRVANCLIRICDEKFRTVNSLVRMAFAFIHRDRPWLDPRPRRHLGRPGRGDVFACRSQQAGPAMAGALIRPNLFAELGSVSPTLRRDT